VQDDRTEPATPRRRKKAREEGRVARSAELVTALILLGILWASPSFAPAAAHDAGEFCIQAFELAGSERLDIERVGAFSGRVAEYGARLAMPALGSITLIAFAVNVLQVGVHFTPGLLQAKFERIDPLAGAKRLVSGSALVELLKGSVKIGILIFSGWDFIQTHLVEISTMGDLPSGQIAPAIGGLGHGLALRMAGTFVVVAILDYAYQRWQFEKSLKMTKQEVKDEVRETEGNQEIKGRIRQRQREFARRRMMAAVPTASVVITNPTHFAVALEYRRGEMAAPIVIAKGADFIAAPIRERARKHGVPMVENKPLAQTLFKTAEVGDAIPASLFAAVAEVLAQLIRLKQLVM
jgi:flagellar biosynthetic protein FlhB